MRQWGDFQSHGSVNEIKDQLFGDKWMDNQIPAPE